MMEMVITIRRITITTTPLGTETGRMIDIELALASVVDIGSACVVRNCYQGACRQMFHKHAWYNATICSPRHTVKNLRVVSTSL